MAELFRGHQETLTSCCAAWSGCPSRALAGPRRRGPIAVTTCWPAAPPEKRQRPRRLLSSSRRRSVPGRCPASSRSRSSEAGTIHVESPPHTHTDNHTRQQEHTSIFLPTSSVLATKLKLKHLVFPGSRLMLSWADDSTTHHWLYSCTHTILHTKLVCNDNLILMPTYMTS